MGSNNSSIGTKTHRLSSIKHGDVGDKDITGLLRTLGQSNFGNSSKNRQGKKRVWQPNQD